MLLINFLYFQNSGGGESAVCCGSIILIIVAIIFIAIKGAKDLDKAQARQAQILAEARATYQDSLTKLKADPTNSNLTRNNKGVTVFDEVALANDINAACGGTTRLAEDKTNARNSDNRI